MSGNVKPSDAPAKEAIASLEQCASQALEAALPSAGEASAEVQGLRDLVYRARKLKKAADRPAAVGFFGPSQAGKSFLVGALLSHELGSLDVLSRGRELDFLREINPAKGVESTGVVTRFSTRPLPAELRRGDFFCRLLGLEVLLESLATGFLVECTCPAIDAERLARCLRDARLQAGPAAPPLFREAWDATWHNLVKKYQDRHPYLNDLRRAGVLQGSAWQADIRTIPGWLLVYSLLWGGPGYAPDLERLAGLLVEGLGALGHAEAVEVSLDEVRASSQGVSVIDAACLNSVGTGRGRVSVHTVHASGGSEVTLEPGVLSALISEIVLPLRPSPGSLLDRADMLDFPGGRALKGINGFGPEELGTGRLENAVEVFKRGKLTFLFEQFALDREITALVLCSPGPTKPEAIQLQSQVEAWLRIRHGAPTPSSPHEVERPSLFMALTKFDMSLGALRSDNAKDRWESRVHEACVDFWARSSASWILNWGAKGRPFKNMFWIRNPYADQMRTLGPGDRDYAVIKAGYLEARAVERHIEAPEEKWQAVEGEDPQGTPRSGVPLLAQRIRDKLAENVKARELAAEAALVRGELVRLLKALTPSRDEAEARARVLESAELLVDAVSREMRRQCSGAVFARFVRTLVVPEAELEAEVRTSYGLVAPMSIKASDKVKKVVTHVVRFWVARASERLRASDLAIPPSLVEPFVRELCFSKKTLVALGTAVFPYFSRTTVDPALVAGIMHVTVSDAMLGLFVPAPRRTPDAPVRLSYAEVPAEEGGDLGIDWSDVDLESDEPAAEAENVEVIFAGNRYFSHWATHLGHFYLESRGARPSVGEGDPRVGTLVSLLRQCEGIHVGSEA